MHCKDRRRPEPRRREHGNRLMTAKPNTNDNKLQTIAEVAEEFRVHDKTIRRWIRSGELRAIRLGRQLRIRPSDKEKFLRVNQV